MRTKKTRIAFALVPALLLGLLTVGCSKEEPPPPPVEQAATPLEPTPFTPPEDGLLTEGQVRRFLLAHQALSQVNNHYLDSLSGATPEQRRSVNQALDIARDKVTRKFGLNGYAEYRWILEEAPRRPENVQVLEKLQVTTVPGASK